MKGVTFYVVAGMLVSSVAADTVVFGPGSRDVGVVMPRSGQTVRLDAGAVVNGVIVVSNACNVTVKGKGTVVGTSDAGASIVVVDSSNVKIDGVTLKKPLAVRAVASSVSGVSASNVTFRPYASEADFLSREDVPCLVHVSVDGDKNLACENLEFSNFWLLGGPSRCYSRVEAAVEGRPIRGVSFHNMPEGMELYKVGAVETELPAYVYGNGYRKFLLFGWEFGCGITPELLEKKSADFWASGIEGVGLQVASRYSVMHGPGMRRDDFRSKIASYRKALSKPGLRNSFMGQFFFRSPTNRIDWTDNAAWARIGRSMSTLAWFARETGMKGCLVDTEDYKGVKQFVRKSGDLEYGKLVKLVRRRAKDIFTGVFREYPDAEIMTFWLLSLDPYYFRSPSALSVARDKSDLWPAFVNGILDAMPPSALLTDGNEEGYKYLSGRGDYNLSSVQQRDHVIELIAPENRVKFRSQVRVGFGLYVDAFENAEVGKNGKKRTGLDYRGPAGGSRTGGFSNYAAEASYASSEYVWLWSETRPWVDWEKPLPKVLMTDTTRVSKLNGIGDVLRSISDPETYAFRRVVELRRDGNYVELVPEWRTDLADGVAGGFVWADDKSKMPKGIGLYVEKKRAKQRFGIDFGAGGALRAESARASFIYSVKGVSFGEIYAIGGLAKGSVNMLAAWKREKTFDWTLPTVAVPFKETGGEWRRALSSVRVPENCDEMAVIVSFDLEDGESAWIDRLSAAKIFTIPKDGE